MRFSWPMKIRSIVEATRCHAINLAKFVTLYKLLLLVQKRLNGGKERDLDGLIAGGLGGWWVFGERTAVRVISLSIVTPCPLLLLLPLPTSSSALFLPLLPSPPLLIDPPPFPPLLLLLLLLFLLLNLPCVLVGTETSTDERTNRPLRNVANPPLPPPPPIHLLPHHTAQSHPTPHPPTPPAHRAHRESKTDPACTGPICGRRGVELGRGYVYV